MDLLELRPAESAFIESSQPLPIKEKVVKTTAKLSEVEKRRKRIIKSIESCIKSRGFFTNLNYDEVLEAEDKEWLEAQGYIVFKLMMQFEYWTISWNHNDERIAQSLIPVKLPSKISP